MLCVEGQAARAQRRGPHALYRGEEPRTLRQRRLHPHDARAILFTHTHTHTRARMMISNFTQQKGKEKTRAHPRPRHERARGLPHSAPRCPSRRPTTGPAIFVNSRKVFQSGRDWRLGFGRSQKCPGKATGLSARVRWDDAIVQIYLGWKRESDFIENETQLASLSLGPRHAATSRSNSRDTAW